MSKKKKIIVLSVMVALLVVTGIVNVVLNNNLGANKVGVSSNTTQVSASSQNFYSMYRTERTSTRQQELQFYEAIMKSSTSSDEAKKDAESKKLALIAQMEKELVTEGIIIGKGGGMLKQIGTYARKDIEKFFGIKASVKLWVKVKEDWRNRQGLIHTFGLDNL